MTDSINRNQSTILAGLGTFAFTVVTPGPYTLAFKSTIPYRAAGSVGDSSVTTGASSLSVALKLNSDTLLTVASPGGTQPIVGGSVSMACVAGDVVSAVLTSSAAVDNTLNAIKTTINLYAGVA